MQRDFRSDGPYGVAGTTEILPDLEVAGPGTVLMSRAETVEAVTRD
jgi:hypothetical protein